MFWNVIKIRIRALWHSRLYSGLNIFGLALGITASMLIFAFVKDELSYDRYFPKSERIYRLTQESFRENGRSWAVVSPLHGLEIQQYIPEIQTVGRLMHLYNRVLSYTPEDDQPRRFEEQWGYYADSSIVDIFDLPFLAGDPATALKKPYSVVLTSQMAQKYFGDEDPMGKTLLVEDRQLPLTVTGVMPDLPFNTHLRFEFLISMSTFYKTMREAGNQDWLESRGWAHFLTYLLLGENQSLEVAESRISDFQLAFFKDFGSPEEILSGGTLHFQPIPSIHLYSHLEQEMGPNSHAAYVLLFTAVAILILVIAAVNFINIATVQAIRRLKEAGIRKVLGANRAQLIWQFLSESTLITLLSGSISLILLELFLPLYITFTERSLSFGELWNSSTLFVFGSILLIMSLLGGLYPALFVTRLHPVLILKSSRLPKSSISLVRRGLVIYQFVISIFMIICTLTIWRQMQYFQNKNIGFDSDQLIALQIYGELQREIINNAQVLKQELQQQAAVLEITTISTLPGNRFSVEDLRPEGTADDEELPTVRYLRVGKDFLKTFKIQLLEGRDFTTCSGDEPVFIINESTVSNLNLTDPVGQIATNFRGTRGEIIGVVKDFNFASLHSPIEPLVLELNPNWSNYLVARIAGDRIEEAISLFKRKFEEIAPGHIFRYVFIDDQLARQYRAESRVNQVFSTFAGLAVLISCLGLFGLAAYSAELRTKEMGIRKVLGASLPRLMYLFSKDYTLWLLLSNLIAWPAAFFMMDHWLQNFHYRTATSPSLFLLASLLTLAIALSTVFLQAIRVARVQPIKTLRYE